MAYIDYDIPRLLAIARADRKLTTAVEVAATLRDPKRREHAAKATALMADFGIDEDDDEYGVIRRDVIRALEVGPLVNTPVVCVVTGTDQAGTYAAPVFARLLPPKTIYAEEGFVVKPRSMYFNEARLGVFCRSAANQRVAVGILCSQFATSYGTVLETLTGTPVLLRPRDCLEGRGEIAVTVPDAWKKIDRGANSRGRDIAHRTWTI